MRKTCLLVGLLFASFPLLWAEKSSEAEKSNLYVIGCASNQTGGAGGGASDSIGGQRAWGNVLPGAATIVKNHLYTVEGDGSLQRTDLVTGKRTQIGNANLDDAIALFTADGKLYTIDSAGTLDQVQTSNGTQSRVGEKGAWKGVRAKASLKGSFYSIEADGVLYKSNLVTGKRTALSKADFKDTAFLFPAVNELYAIKTNGTLLKIHPKDGSYKQVGPAEGWKGVAAGTILKGKQLYTAEKDDADDAQSPTKIWVTELATGKRTPAGNKDFGDVSHLLAVGDKIYAIEVNGALKAIATGEARSNTPVIAQTNKGRRDGLDEWNCFAEQFEEAFTNQAKAFHRQIHSRLLLGAELTRESLFETFAWVRDSAKAKDLMVMYITTHGDTSPETGWKFVIAGKGDVVTSNDLKEELGKLPCRVILMIESCMSGGFIKSNMPLPPNVTAICGALPGELMDNELDIALYEGLYGRADFNKNGIVDLNELMKYIKLRFLEDSCNGRAHLTPVMSKAKSMPGTQPMTRVAPNLVGVSYNGAMYSALLGKQVDDRYQIFLLGFDTIPSPYFRTNEVTAKDICFPKDGPPLEVKQNDGTWSPAHFVPTKGDGEKCRVRYLPEGNEEVVTKDRIRFPFAGNPEKTSKR